MPTYVYLCDECGEKFERANQAYGSDTCDCPECDQVAIRQFDPQQVQIRMPKMWMQASRSMMLPNRDNPEFAQKSWAVGGLGGADAADGG